MKQQKRSAEPTIAPGLDRYKALNEDATPEEIKRGEYTKVVRMSYDEVDPSGKE